MDKRVCIARILTALRDKKLKYSKLLLKVGLTSDKFAELLSSLQERGCINVIITKQLPQRVERIITITEKGCLYLELYEMLADKALDIFEFNEEFSDAMRKNIEEK